MDKDRGVGGPASQSPGSRDLESDEVNEVKESTDGPKESETALEKVISRIASLSSHVDPGPPPDGGLKAWTQAIVSRIHE